MRRADLSVRRGGRRLAAARRARQVVLLTGFAPFGGSRVNASERIVRALHGTSCRGALVVGAVLPCTFAGAVPDLRRALYVLRPAVVVCLGEADRAVITPERRATNWDEARIPDNRGRQPSGAPAVAGAPPCYAGELPVLRIVRALRRRRIAAEASDSAGAYVCNHLFFGLMDHLARRAPARRPAAGFIHVPALRGTDRLSIRRQAQAIALAIRTTLTPFPRVRRR